MSSPHPPTPEKATSAPKSSSSATPLSKPPAENSVSPAQAKKILSLQAKIAKLEAQIKETEEKQREVDAKLKTKDPHTLVQTHIKLLHDYNEIRDVGQGLMGMIAESRGVRVVDVLREFGIEDGD